MKNLAVITGAASGIGRATADKFINHNVPVALIDANEEQLNELKQAYPHHSILVYKGDISNNDEMERIFFLPLVPTPRPFQHCLLTLE